MNKVENLYFSEISSLSRGNPQLNVNERLKPSQNSKLVDNLQQGISTGFQLFKNVESKIRQKSSKSGHNTPGNMTPSQVSPTHEPMTIDDTKLRGSHGTPTSPTKSMGSNKSNGNKSEESYRYWFEIDSKNN